MTTGFTTSGAEPTRRSEVQEVMNDLMEHIGVLEEVINKLADKLKSVSRVEVQENKKEMPKKVYTPLAGDINSQDERLLRQIERLVIIINTLEL